MTVIEHFKPTRPDGRPYRDVFVEAVMPAVSVSASAMRISFRMRGRAPGAEKTSRMGGLARRS